MPCIMTNYDIKRSSFQGIKNPKVRLEKFSKDFGGKILKINVRKIMLKSKHCSILI